MGLLCHVLGRSAVTPGSRVFCLTYQVRFDVCTECMECCRVNNSLQSNTAADSSSSIAAVLTGFTGQAGVADVGTAVQPSVDTATSPAVSLPLDSPVDQALDSGRSAADAAALLAAVQTSPADSAAVLLTAADMTDSLMDSMVSASQASGTAPSASSALSGNDDTDLPQISGSEAHSESVQHNGATTQLDTDYTSTSAASVSTVSASHASLGTEEPISCTTLSQPIAEVGLVVGQELEVAEAGPMEVSWGEAAGSVSRPEEEDAAYSSKAGTQLWLSASVSHI